jgi:hypothetical protein
MPLYPSKVLRAKEQPQSPCFSAVFSLGFTFESLKELGAHHKWYLIHIFKKFVHFYIYF